MKNASYATNGAQLQLAIHSMGGFLILHTYFFVCHNIDWNCKSLTNDYMIKFGGEVNVYLSNISECEY